MAEMMKNPIDLSEVQDFSMAKKSSNSSAAAASFAHGKGKLDDMLTKLMKKNNCVSVFHPFIAFLFFFFFV